MSYSLYILNEKFIDRQTLESDFKQIAEELKLNFEKDKDDVKIFQSNFGDLLEFGIIEKRLFDSMMNDENFIKNFSCLFWINILAANEYDNITLPFLKKFINRHPQAIVYNEDSKETPFTFNKTQIDLLPGNEFVLLTEPPK